MGKKVFDFDGRQIIIKWPFKHRSVAKSMLPFVTKSISNSQYSKYFPRLKVKITNKKALMTKANRHTSAWVKKKYPDTIFLNPITYILTAPEERESKFKKHIQHELVHLVQQKAGIDIQPKFEITLRSRERKLSKQMQKTEDIWAFLRSTLFLFVHQLSYEGVARYVGHQAKKPHIFSHKILLKKNIELCKKIHFLWGEIQDTVEQWKNKSEEPLDFLRKKILSLGFTILSYKIGSHMVYTIRFADIATVRELVRMKPFKFIRTYERACEKLSILKIVSVNDPKAVFCYNVVLKDLYKMVEHIRK